MDNKYNFVKAGKNVTIHEPTTIINASSFHLHNEIIIAEYCWLMGSSKTYIGNFNHIACHTSFTGGNLLILEDFVSLSAGVKLIPGSDNASGYGLINSCIPSEYRAVTRSYIHVKKHAFLSTGVIVYPGVTIGEGAVVSAGSIVTKDIEPWTINMGFPCRPIQRRNNKENLIRLSEKLYLEKKIEPFYITKDIEDLKRTTNLESQIKL